MKKNKLSIVSVCYNCKNDIEKTIHSLLSQTFKDFEYIIIDGNSTDGTKEIMKKYSKKFKKSIFISESDKGIYDAMNKGISKCSNDYIFFLNIGDVFYNEEVLENVFNKVNGKDIYYGNIIYNDKIVEYPNKLGKLFWISEKTICHQAIFASSKLLKENKFNLDYRYCADRDWLIKCIEKNKCSYEHLNTIICKYDANGFSSNADKVFAESKIILKKHFPYIPTFIIKIKNRIGKFVRGEKK